VLPILLFLIKGRKIKRLRLSGIDILAMDHKRKWQMKLIVIYKIIEAEITEETLLYMKRTKERR